MNWKTAPHSTHKLLNRKPEMPPKLHKQHKTALWFIPFGFPNYRVYAVCGQALYAMFELQFCGSVFFS